MASLTPLSLDTARSALEPFGVEPVAVEPLVAGSVNSNFRVRSADGACFFARIYEEQDRAGALRELGLLAELHGAGLPTVVALAARSGERLTEVGEKPFAVFPWVDGEILCQARVTPEACFEVGRALAAIHGTGKDAAATLGGGRFRVADMLSRLDGVERTGAAELALAARRLKERAAFHASHRDEGLPSGVVHGDLFRDNVLWRGGRIVALLDFESASRGPFAYDLAVTLVAWCYSDRLEPELARAMARGYAAARALDPRELAALDTEAAIACVRFATTRITDFSLRTPPGQTPARDYRRFLDRLERVEAGELGRLVRAGVSDA
jgi:homoserine kinase type II